MNRSMLASNKQDWETPASLYEPLDKAFGFKLDVCATHENTKHRIFYTPLNNGLVKDWHKLDLPVCWCNPPYNETAKWAQKAYEESLKGCTVVCLVAARPDTKAWQNVIFPYAKAICFIRGRIKFVGAKDPAMFPSALVVFRQDHLTKEQITTLRGLGSVVFPDPAKRLFGE